MWTDEEYPLAIVILFAAPGLLVLVAGVVGVAHAVRRRRPTPAGSDPPTAGSDIGLELVDLQRTPQGLTIGTYRTTGRPRYET